MPEMLKPSSAIMGAGLGNDVALLTDGRFSGGSHGFLIGHIVPEAQEGGPIALVEDGDEIRISAEERVIDLIVAEEELERRRRNWKQPPLKYNQGTLYKYARYFHVLAGNADFQECVDGFRGMCDGRISESDKGAMIFMSYCTSSKWLQSQANQPSAADTIICQTHKRTRIMIPRNP
jgi:Dehydratase family